MHSPEIRFSIHENFRAEVLPGFSVNGQILISFFPLQEVKYASNEENWDKIKVTDL